MPDVWILVLATVFFVASVSMLVTAFFLPGNTGSRVPPQQLALLCSGLFVVAGFVVLFIYVS